MEKEKPYFLDSMIHPKDFVPALIVVIAFACTYWVVSPPQVNVEKDDDVATSEPAADKIDASHQWMGKAKVDSHTKSKAVPRNSSNTGVAVTRKSNHRKSGDLGNDLQGISCTFANDDHSTPGNEHRANQRQQPKNAAMQAAMDDLDIPSICSADLPGLDFQDHKQAIVELSKLIRDNKATSESGAAQLKPPIRNQGFVPRNLPTTDSISTADSISMAKRPATSQALEVEQLRKLLVEPAMATESNSNHNAAIEPASYNPHANASGTHNANYLRAAANPEVDPHAEVFSRTAFPSATECKSCHEQIYREWSVSGHAYAAVSPMFHKFEQKINDLAQGTIGYFCMRCHAPVATTMELRRDQPIWDGPRVFREGVTCVACHRVVQAHGKDNGERRIEPGPIEAPIVGSSDGIGVEFAKKHKDFFKVKTDRQDKRPGQLIHRRVIKFDQLSKSTFCVSCHQVAVEPGIALEVVWNQYRASPAWRDGVTCQDCHMGRVPGMTEGYSIGPVAVIEGKQVSPDRKHSNHQFYGPGYSIAHPGVFPQNPDADKWTFNEWLQFDWRSGWGTEEFETALRKGLAWAYFPPVWANVDDRMDAREIIVANLKLLGYKRDLRRQVMENGAKVEGPFFAREPQRGKALAFHYLVRNISTGHNMPSGSLGAQPQLWLNVVLIGPRGNRVWESGYLDTIGDLADHHSADVLSRKVPLDTQLFNLQTKFLTTNVKGTDREMYLPINVDIDQLPFIRPDPRPNTVMNHPPFIRMEAHSIAATGSRRAKYKIPARLMNEPGCYRLSVRMRSRAEPIYFMKFVDATPEMIRSMNEGILDVHTFSKTFIVR